ncbi:MAG: aminotransferase class I/II-fold pyridoxal phosphate-dependent enzyme [Candidatus Cardinium sp.]|nr:aminotransferase class I/II-fold pyridoxal phosphate-dependent enzyme [Candidatus Cardinium sp.]
MTEQTKIIDLRSDTVTLPTIAVIDAMGKATVGDAAYGEDQSCNGLLAYCKQLFDKEDGLFVTSGTLANRLAIASQTTPGDEVITHYNYHIHFFDSAGNAKINSVVLNCIQNANGVIDIAAVEAAIHSKPRYKHFAQVKLVTIENSINGFNGKIYPFDRQVKLYQWLQAQGIALHIDGARIWNAHVATGISLSDYAKHTDTISCSFTKGLGGPFGAMLLGSKQVIERAKKLQLWLGSGYHQIGYYAHAAKYVMQQQLTRLAQDHQLAKLFADGIQSIPYIQLIPPYPDTNIVGFSIKALGVSNTVFLETCQAYGLLLFPWLEAHIRAVIHLGIDQAAILAAVATIKQVVNYFIHACK